MAVPHHRSVARHLAAELEEASGGGWREAGRDGQFIDGGKNNLSEAANKASNRTRKIRHFIIGLCVVSGMFYLGARSLFLILSSLMPSSKPETLSSTSASASVSSPLSPTLQSASSASMKAAVLLSASDATNIVKENKDNDKINILSTSPPIAASHSLLRADSVATESSKKSSVVVVENTRAPTKVPIKSIIKVNN